MNREEAIRKVIGCLTDCYALDDGEGEELIEALKQILKEPILDKIKTEIEQSYCTPNNDCELLRITEDLLSAYDLAIKSLEMQKKLAEFSGMDICNLVADYNYDDEENISEYVYEADVDDFLIDEINAEMEAEMEEE